MAETIVLDPAAVATSRTALDITVFISSEGVNWDDARIEQYLSDGNVGSSPVDYKIPNRQVVMPMRLMARGTFTFEQIRRQLQAKVALFQREGGWVSRVTTAGTHYADVQNASLRLGGDWLQASKSADMAAELSLELTPDWYGAEVTLDDKTETTALALTTVLKQSASDAVIAGDYPARVRIVVDEDDGDTQLGLIWGFRSRYYDSAATAALTYQAETLTPLDTAANAALTGASGGTAVTHSALRTSWTAVLSTAALTGGTAMTHRGTYRVWSRCYSTSTTPPAVRFVWKVGDLVNPKENDRKTIPAPSNFYWLDLGEIRLDAAPAGTHLWRGQVEAIGSTGGENVSVDAIHFVPVDDGYGVLRAPQIVGTPSSFSATDSFTSTTAGTALNGRVATTGGTWATSGDATDYVFDDDTVVDVVGEHIRRQAVSGTNGRFAILGATNYAAVQVEVLTDYELGGGTGAMDQGVIARWTDSSNYLRVSFERVFTVSPFVKTLKVTQVVAGVETLLASAAFPPSVASSSAWWKVRLTVTTGGRVTAAVIADVNTAGVTVGQVMASCEGSSSALATGGTLATGKPGIWDRVTSASGTTRYYDDFRVAALPPLDASLYPNQSAELRTDGIFREDTGGTSYAPAPHIGGLPRLPPSGLENRKVELYLNQSRGDFDQIPDTGIDDISAQGFYRPSWLITPGS